GNDDNARWNLFDDANTGDFERIGRIDTGDLASKCWRARDNGIEHAGDFYVETKLSASVRFGRSVEAACWFSDECELLRVFEWHREARVDALSHFGVTGDDGPAFVGSDANERIGSENSSTRRGELTRACAQIRNICRNAQAPADRCCGFQKFAAPNRLGRCYE